MSEDLLTGLIDDDQAIDEDAYAEKDPENLFPNVQTFVEQFLVIVYARPVDNQRTEFRWCEQWWDHAEAVSRLEALWKAFETLRLDGTTGAAVWWRDYCDPVMAALTAGNGTFKACAPGTHKVPNDLPIRPVPFGF